VSSSVTVDVTVQTEQPQPAAIVAPVEKQETVSEDFQQATAEQSSVTEDTVMKKKKKSKEKSTKIEKQEVEIVAETITTTEERTTREQESKESKESASETFVDDIQVVKKKKKQQLELEAVTVTQKEQTTVEQLEQVDEQVVVSEESTTKKKKKSKTKTDKTSSETVEEAVSEKVVEKVEEKQLEKAQDEQASEQMEENVLELNEEEEEGPLPVIEVKPEPTTVKEGETIRLVCKVADEPPTEISWAKNGKKLKSKKKDKKFIMGVDEQTGVNFLEITEATVEDIGEYTMRAESDGGIVACTVSVSVVSQVEKKPPRLEIFPKPQTLKEGTPLQLSCKVSGMI